MTEEQQSCYSRHQFVAVACSHQQVAFEYVTCRITHYRRLFKRTAFKLPEVAPQVRFVDVGDRRAERRDCFVTERPRLVEQRGDLFAGCLAFFRSDAQIEPAVACAIWTTFRFDLEGDDTAAIVERDAI